MTSVQARRCRYCVLRVEPGGCATLSLGGNSIFLSFIFLSSAAVVACGSLSHRLKVAASDAGIPSFTGYRLEYDLANALQYLISEGVLLADLASLFLNNPSCMSGFSCRDGDRRPATSFDVRVPLRQAATGGGSQDDGLQGEPP
jgi:hypothetical protein